MSKVEPMAAAGASLQYREWLSHERRVRIRTNMEIYWDHAFLALGAESAPLTVTRLAPVAADLHARGWSRVRHKRRIAGRVY